MEKKLGIYARQSKEKKYSQSIEDQILQGQNKAKELSLPYELYVDRDVTGGGDTLDERPEAMRLLNDVECGVITSVFVFDESRLTRNFITKQVIKKTFAEKDVQIHTVLDGQVDFNDSNSEFLSDLKTLFAARYLRDTSLKIKSVLRKNASQGRIHGGLLKPYGYKSDSIKMLTIDEEEAVIIKQIYNLYLLGNGTGAIAKILNAQGVPTKGRKHLVNGMSFRNPKTKEVIRHIPNDEIVWSPNVILSVIRNPIYKGQRRHKGETFACPAIIDTQTWDRAQEQRKTNLNAPGLSKHNYLLKNLCLCGRCGSAFCGRTRPSKKDHYYYCASKVKKGDRCGIRSINIDSLERTVWVMLIEANVLSKKANEEADNLKNPLYIQKLRDQKDSLEKQIAVETTSKLNVITLLKRGALSLDEAEIEMNKSVDKIKASKEVISQINLKLELDDQLSNKINEYNEAINQFRKLALTEDFELKRHIVNSFVDKIIIDFDEVDEIYTLNITLKFPDFRELRTYFVNKKGMIQAVDINEQGNYNGTIYPVPSISYVTKLENNCDIKNNIKLNTSNFVLGPDGSKLYQLDVPQKQNSNI